MPPVCQTWTHTRTNRSLHVLEILRTKNKEVAMIGTGVLQNIILTSRSKESKTKTLIATILPWS